MTKKAKEIKRTMSIQLPPGLCSSFGLTGVRLAAEVAMMRGGKAPDFELLDQIAKDLTSGQFEPDSE